MASIRPTRTMVKVVALALVPPAAMAMMIVVTMMVMVVGKIATVTVMVMARYGSLRFWNRRVDSLCRFSRSELLSYQSMEKLRYKNEEEDPPSEVSLLKECAKREDLLKGSKIHAQISRKGLLEKTPHLASNLIRMYVKCGSISRAKQVLEELRARDVLCFNALIAGHAEQGQGSEASKCLDRMRSEGIHPDALTFTCILDACGKTRDITKGKQIHCEILDKGLLEEDVVIGNAVVNMYAKCEAISEARQALEDIPCRNVVTWSTLISCYARLGRGHEALSCFEHMQNEGLSPDAITLTCVLKACASMEDIDKGKQIHDVIVKMGLLEKDVMVGSALVGMYAKCGSLEKAWNLLENLPVRNVISWSSVIAGYCQIGRGHEAIDCFEQMKKEGLGPDVVSYVSVLQACIKVGAIDKGKQLHNEICRRGLLKKSAVLGNALIDLYAKCGVLATAKEVFEELPVRDVVSWSTLIGGYAEEGEGNEALDCSGRMQTEGFFPDVITFIGMLKGCGSVHSSDQGTRVHSVLVSMGLLDKNLVLGNALVDMYVKCGALEKAQKALDELPVQEVVPWNVLLAGYVRQGRFHKALNCFDRMQREGLCPDVVTFISMLKACGTKGAIENGKQIHRRISARGSVGKDTLLANALIDMYAKCGIFSEAERVLGELPDPDVVSWNALISGYGQQGEGNEAMNCFKLMQTEGLCPNSVTFVCLLKVLGRTQAIDKGKEIHNNLVDQGLLGKDLMIGNGLVYMYGRWGMLARARELLEELPIRDVVSWNTLIAGYGRQREHCREAWDCFEQMQNEGIYPDEITFVCILKACATIGAIDKGEQIHKAIINRCFPRSDIMLGNALVSLYTKCGLLSTAQKLLEELPVRDVVSWNALLAGFAENGLGEEALNCLENMQSEGLVPNPVTFLCVLSACNRSGRLCESRRLFADMATEYGISPALEHYTCMAVALGDVDNVVSSSLSSIGGMLSPCDSFAVWLALLSACKKCGDVKRGRSAFHRAVQLDGSCSTSYVLMAHISCCN